jgi:hypothetical protein
MITEEEALSISAEIALETVKKLRTIHNEYITEHPDAFEECETVIYDLTENITVENPQVDALMKCFYDIMKKRGSICEKAVP